MNALQAFCVQFNPRVFFEDAEDTFFYEIKALGKGERLFPQQHSRSSETPTE